MAKKLKINLANNIVLGLLGVFFYIIGFYGLYMGEIKTYSRAKSFTHTGNDIYHIVLFYILMGTTFFIEILKNRTILDQKKTNLYQAVCVITAFMFYPVFFLLRIIFN